MGAGPRARGRRLLDRPSRRRRRRAAAHRHRDRDRSAGARRPRALAGRVGRRRRCVGAGWRPWRDAEADACSRVPIARASGRSSRSPMRCRSRIASSTWRCRRSCSSSCRTARGHCARRDASCGRAARWPTSRGWTTSGCSRRTSIFDDVLDDFDFEERAGDGRSGDIPSVDRAAGELRRAGFSDVDRRRRRCSSTAFTVDGYIGFLAEFDEESLFDELEPRRARTHPRDASRERLTALSAEQMTHAVPDRVRGAGRRWRTR